MCCANVPTSAQKFVPPKKVCISDKLATCFLPKDKLELFYVPCCAGLVCTPVQDGVGELVNRCT